MNKDEIDADRKDRVKKVGEREKPLRPLAKKRRSKGKIIAAEILENAAKSDKAERKGWADSMPKRINQRQAKQKKDEAPESQQKEDEVPESDE